MSNKKKIDFQKENYVNIRKVIKKLKKAPIEAVKLNFNTDKSL